jgi:hypothetical protein
MNPECNWNISAVTGIKDARINNNGFEIPRIEHNQKYFRLISGLSQSEVSQAEEIFLVLQKTTLQPYLPSFQYHIITSDATDTDNQHSLIIDEPAFNSNMISIRTIGSKGNVYTGDTNILNRANEYYTRKYSLSENKGKLEGIDNEIDQFIRYLIQNDIWMRMSACTLTITETGNILDPYVYAIRIHDLTQVRIQEQNNKRYPIWGRCYFFGMFETCLWFHTQPLNQMISGDSAFTDDD